MKRLEIKTAHYAWLLTDFKQWLDILGYAETTVNSLPPHVQELLHFLEQQNVTQIAKVKPRHISEFSNYLKVRTNKLRGGGLSASHINKTLQNLISSYTNLEKMSQAAGCLAVLDATKNLAKLIKE